MKVCELEVSKAALHLKEILSAAKYEFGELKKIF